MCILHLLTWVEGLIQCSINKPDLIFAETCLVFEILFNQNTFVCVICHGIHLVEMGNEIIILGTISRIQVDSSIHTELF